MRAGEIFDGILEGWLKVAIDRVLPFEDYAEAQRVLEERENMGKVLLRVS